MSRPTFHSGNPGKRSMSKFLSFFLFLTVFTETAQAEQFRVLLFTKTAGWHHQSLADAVPAMKQLAAKHH